MSNSSTFSGLKPSGIACRFASVRANSPAPTSNSISSAICVTTRPCCSFNRGRRYRETRPAKCAPVSFSAGHQLRTRGLNGRRQAEDQAAQQRQREGDEQHGPIHSRLEHQPVITIGQQRREQPWCRRSRAGCPAVPLATASTRLSVNSCRISRNRPAPMLKRTAISR